MYVTLHTDHAHFTVTNEKITIMVSVPSEQTNQSLNAP